MKKNVAIVVCNSGFGHLRRVFAVLKKLIDMDLFDAKYILFADEEHVKSLKHELDKIDIKNNEIILMHINSELYGYEKEFTTNYRDVIANVDYVWSDNMVFPLVYNKNTILSGSFLWMQINEYFASDKRIVAEYNPIMIACKYFTLPSLKQLTRIREVGIYDYYSVEIDTPKKRKLLLSCGRTQTALKEFHSHADKIRAICAKIKNVEIVVDEIIYKMLQGCACVRRITPFSEDVFRDINAAVIRPGIGSISDVIVKGGRLFPVVLDDNDEVKHNAAMIEKMGIGEGAMSIERALEAGLHYLDDTIAQNQHKENLRKLQFDGVKDTADIISSFILDKKC